MRSEQWRLRRSRQLSDGSRGVRPCCPVACPDAFRQGECRHRARSARRRRKACPKAFRQGEAAMVRACPCAALRAACRHCPALPAPAKAGLRPRVRSSLAPASVGRPSPGAQRRANAGIGRAAPVGGGWHDPRRSARTMPRWCARALARPCGPPAALSGAARAGQGRPTASSDAESCTGPRRPAFARREAQGECRHRARSARRRRVACAGRPARHTP
jgi:hypothetical protein